MNEQADRWIARLTPLPGHSVRTLLEQSIGIDVWEREPEALIVTASDIQLREIERRRLAHVERIESVAAYLTRMETNPEP
jgi:hypothetical protein